VEGTAGYPVTFSVAYPDRQLNRLTTFFRIIFAIPIFILSSLLTGEASGYWNNTGHGAHTYAVAGTVGGVLVLPTLLMIVFRQKYPRWWYDWNLNVMRFSARIGVYIGLMDDQYPSTDEEQSVRLDFPYPDARNELNRWLPLVKWLLAIPHYIVLFFLTLAAVVAVVIAWFAILFTGRYPRGLFGFVEGVIRWWNRVAGYAFALVTDKYPPFSLSA
jgi:Domain of unknown function (DUF4389)